MSSGSETMPAQCVQASAASDSSSPDAGRNEMLDHLAGGNSCRVHGTAKGLVCRVFIEGFLSIITLVPPGGKPGRGAIQAGGFTLMRQRYRGAKKVVARQDAQSCQHWSRQCSAPVAS